MITKDFSVGSKKNLSAQTADRFSVFCICECIALLVNPVRARIAEGEQCKQCMPHAGSYAARSLSLRFLAE
jgi:hypothetical protein